MDEWIDTHCHLAVFARRGDLDAVLARAAAAGVPQVVTVGTSPADWATYRDLAVAWPGRVAWTAGLHPCDVGDDWREAVADLPRWWEGAPPGHPGRPVALGECGLDRFHLPAGDRVAAAAIFARQREAFAAQLALAGRLGCPVVVHSRGALEECVAMIDASGVPWPRVVLHCFTEGPAAWAEVARRGGRASFTGIVTYRTAEALRETVRAVGGRDLMVETDSPYLAPVPHRGKPNEPAWVRHTGEACAAALGLPVAEVAAASTAAARSFYGLPMP